MAPHLTSDLPWRLSCPIFHLLRLVGACCPGCSPFARGKDQEHRRGFTVSSSSGLLIRSCPHCCTFRPNAYQRHVQTSPRHSNVHPSRPELTTWLVTDLVPKMRAERSQVSAKRAQQQAPCLQPWVPSAANVSVENMTAVLADTKNINTKA